MRRINSSSNTGSRAYLIVKTQFDNAGDALILRELIRLTSTRATTVLYLGKTPENFKRMLQTGAGGTVVVNDSGGYFAACTDMLKSRLRGIRCFYFLTPGGLNGEKTPRQFVADLIRLMIVGALAMIGVRICQVGISLERIGPLHARLLRWRSRLLTVSAPRDEISASYADSLGIRTTELIPDLALNLFTEAPDRLGEDLGIRARRNVCVSFRVDKNPAIREKARSVVRALCAHLEKDADLVCAAQVGRDVGFMRELYELADDLIPGRVRFVECHRDIENALRTYEACRAVVSNRLHVLLLGIRAGATPVALTDHSLDTKIRGVFQELGLSEHVLDVVRSDSELLAQVDERYAFDGVAWSRRLSRSFDEIFST